MNSENYVFFSTGNGIDAWKVCRNGHVMLADFESQAEAQSFLDATTEEARIFPAAQQWERVTRVPIYSHSSASLRPSRFVMKLLLIAALVLTLGWMFSIAIFGNDS